MVKKQKNNFSDEGRQPSYRINNDKKLFEEVEEEKRTKQEEKEARKREKALFKQQKAEEKAARKRKESEIKFESKKDKDKIKARKDEIKQSQREEKKVQKLLEKQYAREAKEDKKEIKKNSKVNKKATESAKSQKGQTDYLDYEKLLDDGVKIDLPIAADNMDFDNDSGIDKKGFKLNIRLFYKFTIAIIACTAVALIVVNFESLVPNSFITAVQGIFTDVGDDYPVDVSKYNIIDINGWDDKNLLTLTDTSLVAFSKKGNVIFERQHGYDSPRIKNSGKYALTYESLGYGIRLDTESKTVIEKKTDNTIIAADVSSGGKLAVVTGADGYSACLSIYDSSFKEEDFKWYSAENSVVDVAISANGSQAAVITLSVSDGKIVSNLVLLNFTKSKPIATIEYNDTMLFSVAFKGNKSVAVVGDNICSTVQLSSPNEHVDYKFDDSNLISFDNDTDSSSVLLALNQHSDLSSTKVVMISDTGKVEFLNDIDGEVISTSLDNKTAAVMTNSKISLINNAGSVIAEYSSSNEYKRLVNFNNQCFASGNSTIDFCKNNS